MEQVQHTKTDGQYQKGDRHFKKKFNRDVRNAKYSKDEECLQWEYDTNGYEIAEELISEFEDKLDKSVNLKYKEKEKKNHKHSTLKCVGQYQIF